MNVRIPLPLVGMDCDERGGDADTDPSEHPMDDGHPPLIALSYDGVVIYAVNDDDPQGNQLNRCGGQIDSERGDHMTKTHPDTYAGEL